MAKAKPKKTTKTPPHTLPHNLTAKEMNFLRYRVKEGNTLEVAYRKAYNTKASPNNQRFEGYRTLQRIITKVGTWHDVFTLCDVGPERIIKTFAEALEANVDKNVPDHRVRIQAGKELMKIHGIGEENVNVNVDITAKDVASNKPYVDMVAETMQQFMKKQNDSDDEPTD